MILFQADEGPAGDVIDALVYGELLYLAQHIPLWDDDLLFIARHRGLAHPVVNEYFGIAVSIVYFLQHLQPIHVVVP